MNYDQYTAKEKPLPELRFVLRFGGRILQQAFLIPSPDDQDNSKLVWRDVPLVENEDA